MEHVHDSGECKHSHSWGHTALIHCRQFAVVNEDAIDRVNDAVGDGRTAFNDTGIVSHQTSSVGST